MGLGKEDLLRLLDRAEVFGCQVISALSLRDAGWIAGHRSFQLVILDMERLSPDGAQSFLEAAARGPAIRVLVMHGEERSWLTRIADAVIFPKSASFEDVLSAADRLMET